MAFWGHKVFRSFKKWAPAPIRRICGHHQKARKEPPVHPSTLHTENLSQEKKSMAFHTTPNYTEVRLITQYVPDTRPKAMVILNEPHNCTKAVKCKKVCHFRSFRALKFESLQMFTSQKFVRKGCLTCPYTPDKTCECRKLKFSETALSFAVKQKLSTFVFTVLSFQTYDMNCACTVHLTAVTLGPGKSMS